MSPGACEPPEGIAPAEPHPAEARAAERPPMSDVAYQLDFQRLRFAIAYMDEIDLDGMLRKISDCQTIAPLFDPTLYMHGAERLDIVQDLVRAARRCQIAGREFQRRMEETDEAARRSREFLDRNRRAIGLEDAHAGY